MDPDSDGLVSLLAPYARRVVELDLTRPEDAQRALNEAFPVSTLGAVREALVAANAAGWLTPKRASPTLTFGRLAKPGPALAGCSADVVDMEGAGIGHTHPNGEVSLAFALAGDPRFVGFPEGWVVAGAGSRHVPEVTGGRMLVVYFLPGGAMIWEGT